MKFVLAANHRFKKQIKLCLESLEALKADATVYDLGGLGQGIPWLIRDNTFQSMGYYRTCFKDYPSRSIHKSSIILDFLQKQPEGQVICYLDADTLVYDLMSEVGEQVFDAAVTVHPLESRKLLGYLNAGVIFFRKTVQALALINRWVEQTVTDGNDQLALRRVLEQGGDWTLVELPAQTYNFRKVTDAAPPVSAKVVHYMASIKDPSMRRMWQMRGVDRN